MYINRAVCAFIEHDGKFLVVTRRNSENWGLVGGKVDKGETEEQALIREVFEESNLVIKKFIPLYSGVCKSDGEERSFFTTTYLVYDIEDINSCVSVEEGVKPMWVELSEFNTSEDVFKEYNTEVVKNYHSIKENILALTKQKG